MNAVMGSFNGNLEVKGGILRLLRRALPKLLTLFGACFLPAGWAFAQSIQVTLVTSHISVTDQRGQYIPDLSRNDFTVMDNGVPHEVAEFSRTAHGPLSVVIVLDRSQSVNDRFDLVKQVASECAKTLVHEPEDRGLLVAFDSKAYLLQDWTSDTGLLVDNIQRLSAAGGSSLFDAVYKTSRDRFRVDDPRRKVMVVITDGEDTTSRATMRQALEMAKLSGVTIYAIGLHPANSMNTRELQGRRVLNEFADLTGGRVLNAEVGENIDAGLASLEEGLRTWYEISYYSDSPLDDTFHRLQIHTSKSSLLIHGPRGYYADRPQELP
jgi:Ca-activated chloride channel homolog